MEPQYATRELTKEEAEALTKDLKEVLEKHSAELGVVSSIQLLKRVEVPKEDGVPSPFNPLDESPTDTITEKGS